MRVSCTEDSRVAQVNLARGRYLNPRSLLQRQVEDLTGHDRDHRLVAHPSPILPLESAADCAEEPCTKG